MTKKVSILIFCAFVCGLVLGCGPKKPDGMPKLVPCQVKVVQEGAPLEGAVVSFYSDTVNWAVSGTTDASGVAKIYTHGTYAGAPEGEYKVTVTKTVVEQATQEPVSASVAAPAGVAYDCVDAQYKMKDSTPLSIKVSGKTTQEFDVGAASRDEIKRI